ncbi:MAG TPA: hypothetical protein PKZ36_01860 [Candidatus Paceibacterota bacterium]|nr:hypothetical protein [Candidatus Paceibacterota bacterium]HPT18132.1 hypothetical protein [Candidatus Paceibacterota bacterium]
MHTLKVTVISKEKIVYEGDAEAVFASTQTGIIEILPGHIQLVSALAKGQIIVKTKDGEQNKIFKVLSGVVEVRKGSSVIILADIEE